MIRKTARKEIGNDGNKKFFFIFFVLVFLFRLWKEDWFVNGFVANVGAKKKQKRLLGWRIQIQMIFYIPGDAE